MRWLSAASETRPIVPVLFSADFCTAAWIAAIRASSVIPSLPSEATAAAIAARRSTAGICRLIPMIALSISRMSDSWPSDIFASFSSQRSPAAADDAAQ